MSQSETTQKNRDTEMGQSSAIQSMDIGQTPKTEEGKKPAMKRRLGMGGPAFMKRTLQVSMQDISIDSDKLLKAQDKKKMKEGKKKCDEETDVYRNVFHTGRIPETSFQRSQSSVL